MGVEWNEWSQHLLQEVKRLSDCSEKIFTILNTLDRRIAKLEVKSGIWGMLGGALMYFGMKFFK